MGSGKTTLGKLLADQLNYTFIDSDQYIELQEKKSITEIFSQHGELYFRNKEREFILHAQLLDKSIISTGAGLPCFESNIELLNNIGTTVWLEVDENILVERLKKEFSIRPKLQEYDSIEDAVHSLLNERRKYYSQAKVSINNSTLEDVLKVTKKLIT